MTQCVADSGTPEQDTWTLGEILATLCVILGGTLRTLSEIQYGTLGTVWGTFGSLCEIQCGIFGSVGDNAAGVSDCGLVGRFVVEPDQGIMTQ